jgi:hypothetical protein
MRGTRDSELGIVVHEDGTMVDTTMNGVPTKVRRRGRGKEPGGEYRRKEGKERKTKAGKEKGGE